MSSFPTGKSCDESAAATVARLNEIRAELSDMAYDVSDADVRSLLNEAKDRLAMAQDLIEAEDA